MPRRSLRDLAALRRRLSRRGLHRRHWRWYRSLGRISRNGTWSDGLVRLTFENTFLLSWPFVFYLIRRTNKAMDGHMDLYNSLESRLNIIKPTSEMIHEFNTKKSLQLTPGVEYVEEGHSWRSDFANSLITLSSSGISFASSELTRKPLT